LVIKERGPEFNYDTWIYTYEGYLMEAIVYPDETPYPEGGFSIADVQRLEIDFSGSRITNTLYYYYGDVLRNISSTVYLRSGKAGE
jgi:hypothetical protein